MPYRILFIETKPTVYGGQKALLARCAELDRRRIDYAIIHPFIDSAFTAQFRRAGLLGRLIQPMIGSTARYLTTRSLFIVQQLLKLARPGSFDVVHADAFDSAYLLAGLRRAGALSSVILVFTIRSERYLRFNAADRLLIRQIDRLWTNSQFSQSAIARSTALPASRIAVTYTPIDFERLKPDRHAGRDLSDRSTLTIGYMGSIEQRKRLDRFLDFGQRLSKTKDVPAVRLFVFGATKRKVSRLVQPCETQAQSMTCVFRGYKTPAEAADEIDILFCPFDNEPLGRVVAEFLYLGVPVGAVDRGGLREAGCGHAHMAVGDTEDALYAAFEGAVRKILDTTDGGSANREAVKAALVERFGVAQVVSRELEIYATARFHGRARHR